MKKTLYTAAFSLPLFALAACETDREIVTFDSTTATPATLSINGTAQDLYTLDASNAGSNVFTIDWTSPDFGLQVPVTNILQMDINGHNFANAQVLTTETSTTVKSYPVVTSNLNATIQTLLGIYGMETPTDPANAITLNFRMASFITGSASDSLFSEVLNIRVLPYEGEAVYPSLGVPGNYNGWSFDGQKLYSPDDNGIYSGMIYFGTQAAEGWKIGTGWGNTENWGDSSEGAIPSEATSATLVAGAANITSYSHASYWISFDTNTAQLEMSQAYDSWGIVGNHNGWGSGDTKMTFGTETDATGTLQCFLTATLDMPAGNTWKIRPDEKWENDKGPGNLSFEGDVADNGDGNFIANEAGNYTIKWYFNKVEPYLVVTKN